jgi:hypothetical protein
VEQVVRLIRSKGVGVYFCTQNPVDIPDSVAGQLGNRIQHALRAFTPKDQKAVKAAAETFRPNPAVDVRTAITELRVGEALVSLLLEDGAPSPVERTLIRPPFSRPGPLSEAERAAVNDSSPVKGRYDTAIDRESAQEILSARAAAIQSAEAEAKAAREAEKAAREQARAEAAAERAYRQSPQGKAQAELTRVATSVGRSMANQVGRSLVRGLLGGLFGGRK